VVSNCSSVDAVMCNLEQELANLQKKPQNTMICRKTLLLTT